MLEILHDDSIKGLKIYSVVSGMVTVGYLINFFEAIIKDIEYDTEEDDYIQLEWIQEIKEELDNLKDTKNKDLDDHEKLVIVNKHIIKLDKIFDLEEEDYLDMVEQLDYIMSDD